MPSEAACISNWKRSSWPYNPDDFSPLQWWHTMPADHLGDAQHMLLRATLEKISVIKAHKWLAGLHGDAAASIAVALGSLPITELALEVDLAMSALTVSSLGGNAGSVMVLSHILPLAPLDYPFAKELSVSWRVLNLRRARETKATAVAPCPEVGTQHPTPHRAALHAGPRFQSDPLTGGFVSDLSGLIEAGQPELWVHGHVHNSSDYRVGRTRLIANPHGYGIENADFNGQLVVEVGP